MKRNLVVAFLVLAQCSPVSASSLPPEDVGVADGKAAKHYFGDFSPNLVFRTVGGDGSRFVFPVPSFGLRLWPDAWRTQIDIHSATPFELTGIIEVTYGRAEGAFFVYSPVSEATVNSQWIISARVSVLFDEDRYGDG